MENYLSEAFKSLDILDEDVFEVDKDGLTALKDFEDKDEDDNSITVVDPDAESEEDLEDSYIGKVILDCSVCHTDIYKDKEDVVIDEESDLANIGEECPYCYSSEGFKVIGEVKPFVETTFETDDDVEVKVENESLRRKRLRESKRLDEWFESEPFAVTCSVDEWEAFKNGELLFDLDSEELVTLDDAKNSGLENCLEYDRYEDYGERVKNGRVAFLMYDPGEEYHYVFNESLHEDHSPVSFSRKNTSTNDVKSYMRAEHSNEGVKDNIYTISIDWVSKLKNENGVIREVSKALGISPRNITVNTMNGPGGGWPEISISGSLDDLYKALLVYTDGDSEYALDLLSDYSDVDIDVYEYFGESLHEDTVKQGKYWVNKGDEGTHGKFRTKKAADEQRKAMFARGYKAESLLNEGSRLPKKSWKKIDTIEGETYYGSVYSPKAGKYGFYGNEIVFDGKRLPKNGSKVLVDIYELPEDDDYIEDPSYPYYALLNKNKAESLKESKNDHNQSIQAWCQRNKKDIIDTIKEYKPNTLTNSELGEWCKEAGFENNKTNRDIFRKELNRLLRKNESLKESYNSTLGDLISGDSATLMSPFYLGKTGEVADVGSIVEVSNLTRRSSIPGGYHYKFFDKNGNLFYEDDLWLYNYDLDKNEDDSWINPDLIKVKLIESLKESCSINQCQKWVDYDMKKYKKISDDTMEKIKSSGYSVVKDQYGDYEVIADRKDESLKESQSLKSDKGNRLYVGWTPFNSFDDFKNRWFENNSYDKYVIYKNGDKWVITTKHAYEKSDNPTWYEIDSRLMRDIKKDAELKKLIKDESLKESIEDITIDTGDQEISVSARDKEKKSDGEMIAPLSNEVKADIEMNSDDVDVDVDEFSEEDFDELGESYLKKVYENVKSYKTTSAKTQGNKLFIEGLIKFSSGKEKKTSFVFESRTITKSGKAKLIGENLQISRGHKSFKLTGTVNNGKFISESLNYNYRVKNGNSSQRVYGTAKKSK